MLTYYLICQEIYPNLKDAIEFCYKFYTFKHFKENLQNSSITSDLALKNMALTEYFRNKLSKFEIHRQIYAIHFGIFHEKILPERDDSTYPSITTIMADIRAKLYPWILDEKYKLISLNFNF